MATAQCVLSSPCTAVGSKRSVQCRVARPTVQRPAAADERIDPFLLASVALAGPFLDAAPAFAKGGEYGLLEGRTAALIHPAMMASMFGATFYAGWLGWQVRTEYPAKKI